MKTGFLAWGVLGFLLARPASAAVMVAPIDGTNLEPAQVDAISQMLASAYQMAETEAVIPLAQTRRAVEQSGSVPLAAKSLGASEYVYGTAVRLDTRIAITATRYALDGSAIYTAKMTAASLDDVEPASERLARALVRRQSPTDTKTLDTVTSAEAAAPFKTWSNKLTGFKAGLTVPIGWGQAIDPLMNAGFALRLDGQSHFLEFGVGISVPASATSSDWLAYGGAYADLGADFYLLQASTAPYLGFGVLPRLMSRQVTNFAAYVQGGAMFFRESKTRLYLDLRVAQNLLPVGFGGSSVYDSASGSTVTQTQKDLYPTEVSLNLGIGW
jgi:hypothetical protein